MSKFTSLTTAAALLSTLALPALAITPHQTHHRVVKHPIHRIAATPAETAMKPATPAMTAPATTVAKPVVTTPAPVAAAKPTPLKPN